MSSNDPHTLVDEILTLTDSERSDALCFIAGYAPGGVQAALKQTARLRAQMATYKTELKAVRQETTS